MIYVIFTYYILISLITLTFYGLDKFFAIKDMRRTPERTLHLLAFVGGVWGAWIGMILFRHKKNKLSFILVLILASVIHGYILMPYMQQLLLPTDSFSNSL